MISPLSKYGLALALVLMSAEWLYSRHRRDEAYERRDTLANIGIAAIGNAITVVLWSAIAYAAYQAAYHLRLFDFSMSSAWHWLACIVAADIAWYLEHRLNHRTRLLWAVHSIHHSSEKFNLSIAMRLPWLGPLTRIPFLLPLCLLGFPPLAVLTGFSTVLLYQLWLHTGYIGKLGILENIFNTPSHHRVHHGTNPEYLDKNYGGILIIWDRLFGTFAREGETPRYGILDPIASHNPLVIQFRDLARNLRLMVQSPRQAWRQWLNPPPGLAPQNK